MKHTNQEQESKSADELLAWETWEKVNKEIYSSGGINPYPFVLGFKYGLDHRNQPLPAAPAQGKSADQLRTEFENNPPFEFAIENYWEVYAGWLEGKVSAFVPSVPAHQAEQWEIFCDPSYFNMWAVRQIGDTNFNSQLLFHISDKTEATNLKDYLEKRPLPYVPAAALATDKNVYDFFTKEDMEQSMRYGFTLGSDGVKFKDALTQFNNSFNDLLNIKK